MIVGAAKVNLDGDGKARIKVPYNVYASLTSGFYKKIEAKIDGERLILVL